MSCPWRAVRLPQGVACSSSSRLRQDSAACRVRCLQADAEGGACCTLRPSRAVRLAQRVACSSSSWLRHSSAAFNILSSDVCRRADQEDLLAFCAPGMPYGCCSV